MILELIEQVEEQLESSTKIDAFNKQRTQLGKLQNELEALTAKLNPIANVLPVYQDSVNPEITSAIRSRASSLPARLNMAWQSTSKGEIHDASEAIQSLSNDISELHRQLEQGWLVFVQATLPGSDTTQLMKSIPELAPRIPHFTKLRDEVSKLATKLPTTEAEFSVVQKKINDLHEIVNQVEDVPPSVKLFIRKVQSNQASLADLTDEVWEWCSESEDRLRAFKISS